MRPPLKLNAIEQEHLQDMYESLGVARDALPYTEQFDALCQGFQDRAFKNADPEQVYSAILKYVRSSTCPPGELPGEPLDPEKAKLLKEVFRRHAKSGKILPYSAEFAALSKEFASLSGQSLSDRDLWLAIARNQSRSRKPPRRVSKSASREEEPADDDVE